MIVDMILPMQRTAIYHTVSLQMELKEESSLSIGKLKKNYQIQQQIPNKGIPNFHEFLDQFEQVLQTFLIVFCQKHILIQNSWVWKLIVGSSAHQLELFQ